jgi:hypothetical protein
MRIGSAIAAGAFVLAITLSDPASTSVPARSEDALGRSGRLDEAAPQRRQSDKETDLGVSTPESALEELAAADLAAQRWMARFAGLQLVLTAFGLWFIRGTLLETRRAVDEAQQATKAAQGAVEVAQMSAQSELRAYVHLEIPGGWFGGLKPVQSEKFAGMVALRNSGSTPARNVVIRRAVTILPYPLQSALPEIDTGMRQEISLWPDGTMGGVIVPADRHFSQAEVDEALTESSSRRIYMFGRITYTDAFGINRYSNFCYFIPPLSYRNSADSGETFTWGVYPDKNNDFS